MREVKIYVTIQYQSEPREGFGDDAPDAIIAAKCDDIARVLGGEVIVLEIK